MKFDVIITTYNREKSLKKLVENILSSNIVPENIIIVDSSKEVNNEIKKYPYVKYIKSLHGNQPYQRWLGLNYAKNEIIVFFDDDMRITDKNAFNKILEKFKTHTDIVAVQPNFINKNEFLNEKLPKSKFNLKNKKIFWFLKCLTGLCKPKEGKIWYCGIRGAKPKKDAFIEYFNGGVFAVKKDVIFTDKFNFFLFTMFEEKLGMGEDTVLGMEASNYGKVYYISNVMFLHDDQKDSTYTLNIFNYGKRVAYSRLFLSLEYCKFFSKNKFFAMMHYNYYIYWRILGMFLNIYINNKESKKITELLKGYVKGYILALKSKDDFNIKNYWIKELKKNIEKEG